MRKILCLSIIFSTLFATTINIPADYSTIQEGIDASVDGDTVLVAQGIYYEHLILEKSIVLASHAINDDLGSDWLNIENITGTIISGAQEPIDPNKASCLIIRSEYMNINPEIIGLTFQDGDGTSMKVYNCGVVTPKRSGGGILIYKAYPTIMYNRFINNGHDPDDLRAGRGGRTGGAMGMFAEDGVEFDEDRSSSRWHSYSNNTVGEYIMSGLAIVEPYNNGIDPQEIQDSKPSIDPSSFTELEELQTAARDTDFIPGDGLRGDLNIYMSVSYTHLTLPTNREV